MLLRRCCFGFVLRAGRAFPSRGVAVVEPEAGGDDERHQDEADHAEGLDELDHYIAEFSRTGFTGGLNWYRNMDHNWETTSQLAGAMITVPCLFIGGTADPVLVFTRTDRAAQLVSGPYQQVMIDGAGHWLQQERPDEVNETLLGFLKGVEW